MIIQGVDLVGMTDDTGTFVNSFDSSEYVTQYQESPIRKSRTTGIRIVVFGSYIAHQHPTNYCSSHSLPPTIMRRSRSPSYISFSLQDLPY